MAKLFNEKKKEVFAYISSLSKKKEFFNLTKERLQKKFKPKYAKKELNQILDSLLEEDLNEEEIGSTIYYPVDDVKNIKGYIGGWKKKYLRNIYFLVGVIWFFILYKNPLLLLNIIGTESTPLQIFSLGFFVSLIVIYIASQIVHFLFIWIKDKTDIWENLTGKDKYIMLAGLIILVVIVSTQIYFPEYTTFVGVVVTIVLWFIGFLFGKHNSKK